VDHVPLLIGAQTIALDIKAKAKAAEQEWPDKGEEKLDAWLKKVGKIKKPVVQASARPRGSGADDDTNRHGSSLTWKTAGGHPRN
jgi:hypothetical protein